MTVTSDMDVNVFVHCENGRTFHVDQDEDQVHYIAHVHYSGNASGDNCVFHVCILELAHIVMTFERLFNIKKSG